MFRKTDDGSIEDEGGKVIFFSADRFVQDICLGACCFICGAQPGSKVFNDEHIFPEWLLRQFGLFDKTITLPNGVKIRYDRYKVPCCEGCNSLLGRQVEATISQVVTSGAQDVIEFVKHGGGLWLRTWLGLIYFKTHLKDSLLRFHLDQRNGTEKIAEAFEYEWGKLHHLHTLIRHFYTGCNIEPEALGSLFIASTNRQGAATLFDYADLTAAQAQMMRLDDIGFVAIFDDSGAAMSRFHPIAQKIDGTLSPIQLREVHCELAFLNVHLAERTQFHTVWKPGNSRCQIIASRGTLELLPLDWSIKGEMLHHSLYSNGASIMVPGVSDLEGAKELVKSGKFTFLFDEQGKFIQQTLLAPPGEGDGQT